MEKSQYATFRFYKEGVIRPCCFILCVTVQIDLLIFGQSVIKISYFLWE